MSYDEILECGNVIVSSYGLDESIKAYDLDNTDDVVYWIGKAALVWGDITPDGELS
jgi:hypothetical protein